MASTASTGKPPSAVGTTRTDGAVTGHQGCLSDVAPPSGYRACRVLGHDVQAGDTMYCRPHCAHKSGNHHRTERRRAEWVEYL